MQSTARRSKPLGIFGKGRRKPGIMNATEAKYAEHLDSQLFFGRILWYAYEGIRFKLAEKTTYTPDFAVMSHDGTIELHEVKGYWLDEARTKLKVAAALYPFKFKAFKVRPKKDGGGWTEEEF